MKMGILCKKILLAMLKNGAMSMNHLIRFIEGKDAMRFSDGGFSGIKEQRRSSYFRTFKTLRSNNLIRKKLRLKFGEYYGYMRGRFYYAHQRSNGLWYGWYGTKRPVGRPPAQAIYGLTTEGRQIALTFRNEIKRFIKEWETLI